MEERPKELGSVGLDSNDVLVNIEGVEELKRNVWIKNIRVMLFSIHDDDGNPFSVNIKQYCGRSYALSWKSCQGGSTKLNLPDHKLVLTEPEVIATKSQ
ncbi:hypothetical protein Tco_0700199 [Tanacetum coccineum]